MPCPCRAAKGFRMCLSNLIYTVRPCLIHTCRAMSMPCFDHVVLLKATARHGRRETACGLPAAFGFFRLPRGVPRRLLSEAHQSSSQRSIPMTVKRGSSTLQKDDLLNCWTSVRVFPATTRTFTKDTALSEHGRGAA
jgi:hypothetical protein